MASQLVQTIVLLYSMQESDITALSDMLLAQRAQEWQRAVSQELQRYGCTRQGQPPVGTDALELFRQSEADAQSIANTYNRQLEAQVQRLYAENPRGNRNYYYSRLAAWTKRRDAYKSQQIALNTAATTRELAQRRFREENNITGKFLFVGPAPVCRKCVRLKALGLVTLDVVNQYGNAQHIGCPHEWQQARGIKSIDCATAWTGGV